MPSVRTVPAILVAGYQVGLTRKTGQSQMKYHPVIMMTNNLPTISIIIIIIIIIDSQTGCKVAQIIT